jgi:ABC-type arginine/histidine transport system permease subunit
MHSPTVSTVAVIVGFLIVVYLPVTYIMLRNISFRPILKYLFCLTVVPVFVALLIVGIGLVHRYSPEVAALLSKYRDTKNEKALTIIFIVPFPVLGSLLWYLLFRQLDRVFAREA